ncbi:MAG: C-terminal binding protein [Chloroflexi bacterium]|nr:C-terminal binding protein [Chloroflexota bacterium]
MSVKIVVHTAFGPEAPLPSESAALEGQPDIKFVKAGKRRTPAEVLDAVRDADVALCGSEPYTAEVFAGAPKLKAVLRYGVGVDTIDLDAATQYGVVVGYYPDFCIPEVANHALMLMLACSRKLLQMDRTLREEGWNATRALRSPMGCIHGETLGLLAFGNIARAMGQRGKMLDMHVIAYDPFVPAEVFEHEGVESVSLEELARRSDYVSCHIPLNKQTRGMIDKTFFSQMKPTAYFINTSRGAVVNEADLIAALQNGQIAGAGLDVFEKEPLEPDNPLLAMKNVVLTPHMGSCADETYRLRDIRIGQDAARICRGGLPEHVANKAVLDHRRT